MKYKDLKTGAKAKVFGTTLFIYGTGDDQDIKQDLDFVLKNGCHRGASEQADFLCREVDWTGIEKIAGHSLGGAVALILGDIYDIPVVTYGAFRPFAPWYKPKCESTNYIYGWDLVPRLFWWRKFGGRTIRVPSKGFHPFKDHQAYPELELYYGVD